MSETRIQSRKHCWIVVAFAVFLVAGYLLVISGALAIWLDPEPEGQLGALWGATSPMRHPVEGMWEARV